MAHAQPRDPNETLIKVARCIVQRQTGFFDQGEEAMVPLILKDVADGRDARVDHLARDHGQIHAYPRGVFEFRYFFSSHVEAADAPGCPRPPFAPDRKLISQENPTTLERQQARGDSVRRGIPVARRTVASTARACRSPHPTNASARPPAPLKFIDKTVHQ